MNCVAYYKLAENIANNLSTGCVVFVDGTLRFENKKGENVKTPIVTASSCEVYKKASNYNDVFNVEYNKDF